ncbi:GH92 family glycosyl hydrolase [Chryseolinea soli]|uniref:Glycoside hydrolase family 92 protein n=1 Tax=Chryseolinea soli TaxID=2321403 RepID=A0A385SUH6_9BACT|nr:GH92 family glycosyl hydrolase [Chryseolinea soli]AYB34859.1 hypothetical protein D4L85_31655 [Chryseolinea soli]
MKSCSFFPFRVGIAFFIYTSISWAINLKPSSAQGTIWQIGKSDNNGKEFALAPRDFQKFLPSDFGWEDRFFLPGNSDPLVDWPYVMPGPKDKWGGTGPTSGVRTNELNILFGLPKKSDGGAWTLVIDLLDTHAKLPPLLKVSVNGNAQKYRLPAGGEIVPTLDSLSHAREHILEIPLESQWINEGGNEIKLTILDGGWLMFDQIRLEGPPGISLNANKSVFIRSINPADYEIVRNAKHFQPLLVDVEHLSGNPTVEVKLDDKLILSQTIERGRYQLEVPMPSVTTNTRSKYDVLVDGKLLQSGFVARSQHHLISPAMYVDTKIGTAHSRWMIAPGPWMPFSMVKIGPDNQPAGWMAGYDPSIESVGAFSHIHEWTMAGVGMMAATGPLKIKVGDDAHPGEGYRSSIDKLSEESPLGYYKVLLKDYGVKAELTATTRCSFQRFTFPGSIDSRIIVDFQTPAEYRYDIKEIAFNKIDDHTIEGHSVQLTPRAWGDDASQEYTIHFVIEFDQPFTKIGSWLNDSISTQSSVIAKDVADAGVYVEFDTRIKKTVQVRTGISFVSLENARANLHAEVIAPFGWDFNAVRESQVKAWDTLLGRIAITTNDRREKVRFYTNMYRALCSRNTFSDINGEWIDATEQKQKMQAGDVALGCDAFWNTFWNLNQFWNLVTPEWSSRWVKSQLSMYKANGWLAKGPAGMEYIPVMVAEHEIPLIVSAYQMGIRDFDATTAFDAVSKMQTTLPQKVGGGLAGNADLAAYLQYHYVPYDKGRFSNSLEYSYDDYAVAQFSKTLGRTKDYDVFKQRSENWKNVIDPETGYARLKDSNGKWMSDFDPFKSGANEHYVEGNAWQLTFFVPQDVPGLASLIGKDHFVERLNWGFEESSKLRFNAPGDQYWDYPVIQGNQQSMHFAFLFNWVNKPWLTQKWSRSILDRYYGFGVSNAYLGDEDQGQMSAWFIMATLGLFQTDGGCSINPIYEIGSPLFEKVSIDLGQKYGRGKSFTIEAHHASRDNKYVQSATLNGKPLTTCWFPSSELLKGGNLILEMGNQPNMKWGLQTPPVSH